MMLWIMHRHFNKEKKNKSKNINQHIVTFFKEN